MLVRSGIFLRAPPALERTGEALRVDRALAGSTLAGILGHLYSRPAGGIFRPRGGLRCGGHYRRQRRVAPVSPACACGARSPAYVSCWPGPCWCWPIIRNYSGALWSGDWLEHFQRSLFFLHHFPKDTPIYGEYLLPARPPMMNVLAAFFLGRHAGPLRDLPVRLHLLQSAGVSALLPGDAACWPACVR